MLRSMLELHVVVDGEATKANADVGQIHHHSKVMLLSFTLLKTAAKESPMTIRTCSTFLNSS